MREWVIELGSSKNKRRLEYDIVNVIHDQVVVETPIEHQSKVAKLLISTANIAAENVGIDEQTLHFGEVKVLTEHESKEP